MRLACEGSTPTPYLFEVAVHLGGVLEPSEVGNCSRWLRENLGALVDGRELEVGHCLRKRIQDLCGLVKNVC